MTNIMDTQINKNSMEMDSRNMDKSMCEHNDS